MTYTDRDHTPVAEQAAERDDHVTITNIATNINGNVAQASVIHGGITINARPPWK